MSIQNDEALRIREILQSELDLGRLGYMYDIKVGLPKVGNDVEIKVRFQVEPPRLTPMEERYLELCKRYPELRKGWLNSEVQMDGKTLIVIGAETMPSAYAIILRDKMQGANGFAGYHVNVKQLVILMEKQ